MDAALLAENSRTAIDLEERAAESLKPAFSDTQPEDGVACRLFAIFRGAPMPSTRDIAFVGCRLLAVYALYSVLLTLAISLSLVSQVLATPGRSLWQVSEFAIHNGALMLANIVAFAVLWFGAGWLAGRISVEASETKEQVPCVAWSARNLLAVALTLLGLWVLVHHLPTLATFVPLILEGRAVEITASGDIAYRTQQLITALLTTALGILCVLGAKGIANLTARLRNW